MSETVDILLVHGWMGDPGDWDRFCECLPSTVRSQSLCLPGHGPGAGDAIPEWSTLIHELSDSLEQQSFQRKPWLIGYSLGGRVCLDLAASAPDAFAGMVLLGARPGWSMNTPTEDRKQTDARWASDIRADFPAMLREWYRQDLFADLIHSETFPALLSKRSSQNPEAMAQSLCRWSPVHQLDRIEFLQFWNRPRLWISGREDMVYARLGRELERLGGCSARIEIEQAGHALLWEKPERCAEVVMDFILNKRSEDEHSMGRS